MAFVPVVRNGGIETFGLPFGIGGEGDPRHGFPFRIGRETNGKISKAITNFHGSDVAIGINEGRSAPGHMG